MNDNSGLQRFEGTCDQGGASETLIEYTPGSVHIGVWPLDFTDTSYAVWTPKQAKRIAKAIKGAAREAQRLDEEQNYVPYVPKWERTLLDDTTPGAEGLVLPLPIPSPPQGSDSVLRQPRAGEVWRLSADGLDDYADTDYYHSASAVRLAFYDAPDGTLWYIRTNHGDPGWVNPWESVADKHRWIYSHGLHGSTG